jgi:hypothetical protein
MSDTCKKFVPWMDLILYGGIALASVVGALIAIATPQEWDVGKVVVLIIVPLAFITLALIVCLTKYFSKPDFITTHSAAIWTGGIKEITQDKMNQVLSEFCLEINKEFCTGLECVINMLSGSKIIWKKGSLSYIGVGWQVKDKAGLQQGSTVIVQWNTGILDSALVHELGHMFRQQILGRPIDYIHADKAFWDRINKINDILKENVAV